MVEMTREKTRIKEIHCTEETDRKYQEFNCHPYETVSDIFDGCSLGRVDKHGKDIKCGNYVRNDKVSGRVIFVKELLEFKVQVLNSKWFRDLNSIQYYYNTFLGRDEQVNWEVFDGNPKDLEEWLDSFPKQKSKKEV